MRRGVGATEGLTNLGSRDLGFVAPRDSRGGRSSMRFHTLALWLWLAGAAGFFAACEGWCGEALLSELLAPLASPGPARAPPFANRGGSLLGNLIQDGLSLAPVDEAEEPAFLSPPALEAPGLEVPGLVPGFKAPALASGLDAPALALPWALPSLAPLWALPAYAPP